MSPLTRETSSEARQYGEARIVPWPIVKSATSASSAVRYGGGRSARHGRTRSVWPARDDAYVVEIDPA
jgi:hypothetical protein